MIIKFEPHFMFTHLIAVSIECNDRYFEWEIETLGL